jgi:hypothetical protein
VDRADPKALIVAEHSITFAKSGEGDPLRLCDATKYTKAANRKHLATDAMLLPPREQKKEIDCPTKVPHQKKNLMC